MGLLKKLFGTRDEQYEERQRENVADMSRVLGRPIEPEKLRSMSIAELEEEGDRCLAEMDKIDERVNAELDENLKKAGLL